MGVSPPRVRKLTEASAPTSKRDLEELAKSGLFQVFGGGRSTAYRLCSHRVIFGSIGSRTVTGNGSSVARPAIHFPISASQLFRVFPPTGDKSGCLGFSTSVPVRFGTQCVPNWKKRVERPHIEELTLIKTGTKLGGQPLSHQRQQSCAILGPRPASWLALDQVPSHFPVGACTPSQIPTHWSVSPATRMGVSPLPTPSWGSTLPGTPSPSSARSQTHRRHPLIYPPSRRHMWVSRLYPPSQTTHRTRPLIGTPIRGAM